MKPTVMTLTGDQTRVLLHESWGRAKVRDRQMVRLLLHTGIKIGELVNLNVGDVHTGNRVKKSIFISPRIGKRWRRVPLDRSAREAIALVLEYNRSQGFILDPDFPLFISRQRNKKDDSYRITSRQAQRIARSLGSEAAIGFTTTPRTFRHTFAKTLVEQGAELPMVQRLLGHRDLKTTRAYYGNDSRGLRTDALAAAFGPREPLAGD
jgi:integrase/recombinase XerD